MKKSNRLTNIFFSIGIILLFISFLSLIYFEYEVYNSKINCDKTLELLQKEKEENNNDKIVINDSTYIGELIIPSLDLELPITESYTQKSLKTSPSLYSGSFLSNNVVICGHSYSHHFGNLYKLKSKDEIIFVDNNNKKYIYEVELKEVLKPTDIEEMISSDFDLTLYTCTKDSTNRVTIRCNLKEIID